MNSSNENTHTHTHTNRRSLAGSACFQIIIYFANFFLLQWYFCSCTRFWFCFWYCFVCIYCFHLFACEKICIVNFLVICECVHQYRCMYVPYVYVVVMLIRCSNISTNIAENSKGALCK